MDAKVHRTRNIQNNPYLDTGETVEMEKEQTASEKDGRNKAKGFRNHNRGKQIKVH